MAVALDCLRFCYICGARGATYGTLCGCDTVRGGYRSSELGGAEDVREEGVVIETPDAVGAGRFEGVCEDELSHNVEVTVAC
jgi:hypothetical protein